jgi:hypothetical protein
VSGSDASYAASFDHNGDRYGLNAQHLAVEDNFNPEVGFLRHRTPHGFGGRPLQPAASTDAYERPATSNPVPPSDSSARGSKTAVVFSVTVCRITNHGESPFPITASVTIPTAGHTFNGVLGSYTLPPVYRVQGTFSGHTGSFYDERGTKRATRDASRSRSTSRLSRVCR